MLAVALLCSAWAGVGAGPAGAGPNDPTVVFGAAVKNLSGQTQQQAVTEFETQLGRPLTMVRVYYLWDQPFPDSHINWLRSTGHHLFLSVKAKRTNGQNILWRSIADAQPGSALHNDMVSWATKVKNLGAKTYFIFHHEPEAAANTVNGVAADYIAAWRKVISVFRAQNVTNAEYVWTLTSHAFRVNDRRAARLWFPGDAYIDGIGADGYNWYTCRGSGQTIPWNSVQYLFEPFRQFGLAHPTKKLMVVEWASVEDPATPGRKAQWITEGRNLFKSADWSQLTAALYFHRRGTNYTNCQWRVDTSQSALDAFKAMANDVYYTGRP
jgi:hypothetical protein